MEGRVGTGIPRMVRPMGVTDTRVPDTVGMEMVATGTADMDTADTGMDSDMDMDMADTATADTGMAATATAEDTVATDITDTTRLRICDFERPDLLRAAAKPAAPRSAAGLPGGWAPSIGKQLYAAGV